MKTEKATFGMGCFWKPDLLFSKLDGVTKTEVGYMGGDEKKFPNPTYEQVCSNKTGFVEVARIEFNPEKTSYSELLELFWKNHDPTTPDRQGFDIGSQYRSIIFYQNSKQKEEALKSKENHQKAFKNRIVTKIEEAKTFFPAEEYHQKYLEKTGKNVC